MSRYKWLWSGDTRLFEIGINGDGSLHNPRKYPEDIVRAAVMAAAERRHIRRSEAAKKASVTRRRRQEKKIWQIAKVLVERDNVGPRHNCAICGRGLGDTESIQRGIGSECWQDVLSVLEVMKRAS